MHTTVDYSKYDESEKRQRALQDCKDWFSNNYEAIMHDLRGALAHDGITRKKAVFMLSFGGVSGYPAEVMVDEAIRLGSPE